MTTRTKPITVPRLLVWLLALLATLMTSGCGGGDPDPEEPPEQRPRPPECQAKPERCQ